MSTDQGPAQPGKEKGGRQTASDRAATPGQEEWTPLPPVFNGNGTTSRYQVQGDPSCARRRRRSRGNPETQAPAPPPPDWSPAVDGEVLSDTGWVTTDGPYLRVWTVRATNSGTLPEWSRDMLTGRWSTDRPENGPEPGAVAVRVPRKPRAPAGAVALELPLAED